MVYEAWLSMQILGHGLEEASRENVVAVEEGDMVDSERLRFIDMINQRIVHLYNARITISTFANCNNVQK